jgi:metal-responsive CopG/Arc/MetJ family transcriptional regulator
MKHQISITIEEDVLLALREHMRKNRCMNKSKYFEEAIRKMVEGEE